MGQDWIQMIAFKENETRIHRYLLSYSQSTSCKNHIMLLRVNTNGKKQELKPVLMFQFPQASLH